MDCSHLLSRFDRLEHLHVGPGTAEFDGLENTLPRLSHLKTVTFGEGTRLSFMEGLDLVRKIRAAVAGFEKLELKGASGWAIL